MTSPVDFFLKYQIKFYPQTGSTMPPTLQGMGFICLANPVLLRQLTVVAL